MATLIPTTTRDGRSLHVERHGEGSPVVLLESGLGLSRNLWGAVVPLLAGRASVVVYDRAGLGRSPSASGPRDLAHLVDDLLDVLAAVGGGPFVLVGHSWGGPIVRSAAASLPADRVAGLVLVDQTDERCDLFFEAGNRRQTAWAPRLVGLAARLGLVRRATAKLAADLPEPWRSAMLAEDGTPAAAATQAAELTGSIEDLRRLRGSPLVLPDVPVTVISGTVIGPMEKARRPALRAAHAATAAASPQGRHVLAQRSSHHVPLTEPALVADEVLRML